MPRKVRDREKEKAWYKQWWAERGRAMRKLRRVERQALTREQKDRKNAMTREQRAALSPAEREAALAKRRARYAGKVMQPPNAPRQPLKPSKDLRAVLKREKVERAYKLACLVSVRWPPSSLKASQIARQQRHSPLVR